MYHIVLVVLSAAQVDYKVLSQQTAMLLSILDPPNTAIIQVITEQDFKCTVAPILPTQMQYSHILMEVQVQMIMEVQMLRATVEVTSMLDAIDFHTSGVPVDILHTI